MKISLLLSIFQFFKGLFQFRRKDHPIREFTNDEIETLKYKARIALVDDDEISHVRRLQKEGYNIVDFPDISEIDDFIRKNYNVVILDIQGIGKEISEVSGGWGILKYLKTESPHIVVIIFTGADWSVTKYKHLVDLADDIIGKDLEYLDFKSKLDSAIRKSFSLEYHLEIEKKNLLQVIPNTESYNKVLDIIKRNGGNKDRAVNDIKKITTSEDAIKSVNGFLTLVNSILNLVKE